ncbi:MAG: guanylate kinase [Parvibaculaceae bacterium]|nr:guanylate kinase [Parvibaculaceae bacterium]
MSEIAIQRHGLMLVLSSPSGAGKTTLSRLLLEADENISMSVSVTTRAPREGEVDGRDYFFKSTEEFGLMRNRGELLEHAKVFDNYYGTPSAPVNEALAKGRDVLFDIDWQGTQQLMETANQHLVKVFIMPPSGQELEKRLTKRALDPPEVVAARMDKAWNEISHYTDYEYIIINDVVEESMKKLRSILRAERLKRERQIGLANFVRGLQQTL